MPLRCTPWPGAEELEVVDAEALTTRTADSLAEIRPKLVGRGKAAVEARTRAYSSAILSADVSESSTSLRFRKAPVWKQLGPTLRGANGNSTVFFVISLQCSR